MSNQDDTMGSSRRNFIKQAAFGVAGGLTLPLRGELPVSTEKIEQRGQVLFGFAAQPVLANVDSDRIEIIVAPRDVSRSGMEYEKVDGAVYPNRPNLLSALGKMGLCYGC